MGTSLCKGFKVNGVLNSSLNGVKINGETKKGLYLNGNWVEPAPFICTLGALNSDYKAGGTYIYLKDGYSSATVYLDDVETEVTTGVYKWASCTLKIYDKVDRVNFMYSYTTTSKSSTTTKYTHNLTTINQLGGYMTALPAIADGNGVGSFRYLNDYTIPCNFSSIGDSAIDSTYTLSTVVSGNWSNLYSLTSYNLDFILSFPASFSSLCPSSATYAVNKFLPNIIFQNPKISQLNTLFPGQFTAGSDTYNGIDAEKILVDSVTIPKNVNTIYNDTAGYPTIGVFVDYKKQIYLNVYWDRNGNICGDVNNPVANYTRLINPDSIEVYTDCYRPIIRYWGEWTPNSAKGE